MDNPQIITASQLRCARRCAREHLYRYFLLYAPVEDAEALRFGTLFHGALEAWWKGAKGSRLSSALLALETLAMESEVSPYDRVKAESLIVAYDVRWKDAPLEAVLVEGEFVTDLVNPSTDGVSRTWRLGGKLDVIVRNTDNDRIYLMEHKTTSEDCSPGADYWKRLKLDAQISLYYTGAAALGHRVEGCLYDVIRKPGLRPYKATPEDKRKRKKDGSYYANVRLHDETPDEYGERLVEAIGAEPDKFLARDIVVRLESEVKDGMIDAWQQSKMIRENQRLDRAPRNPDACVRFGRTCSFFAVCCGEGSLEDESRYRRKAAAHEELEAAK